MVRVGMVDRWLAERVQRLVAPVAVRLELWDGTSSFSANDPPVGDLVVRDRRTLLGLAVNPDLWFGETYAAGRLAIRGAAEPVVEALSRLSGPAATWRAQLRALLAPPNSLRDARRNVYHYDLGNDFYQLWLDPRPRLHVRVFRGPGDVARRGTACQARSRVPQAAAAAGRHGGRGRVRLGSAGASHGAQLRRDGEGVQRVARAAWFRTRAGCTRRADRSGRVHRRRLPQRAGRVRRVRVGRDAGARRPASFPQPRGRRRSGRCAARAAAGCCTSSAATSHAHSTRGFDGAYFPARIRRRWPRSPRASSDRPACRWSTSRTCVCTTRARWHTGAADLRPRPTRCRTSTARTSAAWELYLAGAQAAFATGWMQLFQIVFTPRESPPPSWTRSELHQPADVVR